MMLINFLLSVHRNGCLMLNLLMTHLLVDGQLLSFVMPKATPGSLLRLREDGADLPITVQVPTRVCMGDVITEKVYGGCLHVTKVEMGVVGAVVGPQ